MVFRGDCLSDNKPFVLYRSSAGSGKTYTLVKEYLKHVLQNPDEKMYKHILAITFTNKAAGEMKERILQALKNLKNRRDQKLEKQLIRDNPGLRNIDISSGKVLARLLHDYSDFAVMTIDSFIHKIIKAFALEIGLPLNFTVELKSERMELYALDNLMAKVGLPKHEDITTIIKDFVLQRLNQGKSWNIELDLKQFEKEILNSKNAHWIDALGNFKDYHSVRAEALAVSDEFISKWNNLADAALGRIEEANLSLSDFKGKSRSPAVTLKNKYANLNRGSLKDFELTKSFRDKKKWFDEKSPPAVTNIMNGELGILLQKMVSLYDSQFSNALTALFIAESMYPAALVNPFSELMEEYKKKSNSVPISDFNIKVNKIVRESAVPFIYVLMGEKYLIYLLDEFQDTSRLQWENLFPLIENSVGSGNPNLAVGDSKQSIYRWRGGDMDIMETDVAETLPVKPHVETLKYNFRSLPEIVDFNNMFFEKVRDFYTQNRPDTQLPSVYTDVAQQHTPGMPNARSGHVCLRFFEKLKKNKNNGDEETEPGADQPVLDYVKTVINQCEQRGYDRKDIAVLVRGKKEGRWISEFLLDEGIDVVAPDSLIMDNIPMIRFLLDVLAYLDNPYDLIAEASIVFFLEMNGSHHSLDPTAIGSRFLAGNQETISEKIKLFFQRKRHLNRMPVYEVMEEVIRLFELDNSLDFKTAGYLQAFLNVVADYTSRSSVDVSSFLEWWSFNKSDLAVEVPEDRSAVKIITIHKAKGLEFPVVIIPFADWDWGGGGGREFLWLLPQPSPLTTPLDIHLPLKKVKTLEKTFFNNQWQEELKRNEIDNINLLYVAFTRAAENLYIICIKPSPKSDRISNALLLDQLAKASMVNTGHDTYTFGEPAVKKEKIAGPASQYHKFISNEWFSRITILRKSKDFWRFRPKKDKRAWGLLVHQVLSEIRSLNDLDKVLARIHASGEIEEKDRARLEQTLQEIFKMETVRQWFDPAVADRAFIESTILTDEGMLRPDRVMVLEDNVIIIDFKTGTPTPKDAAQVTTYIEAVQAMGYRNENIQAYLLYLDNKELKKV